MPPADTFSSFRRTFCALAAGALLALPTGASAFTLFESGQVRPLALSSDGSRLYACNTPDNRLEIFDVTAGGLSAAGSVAVGLEPVAVAVRPGTDEVWVVNHLSDSVSIVDVSAPATAAVTRTLHVGDEPRDIVFAGATGQRAFITAAHRGQNVAFDPEFTTPSVGRADVWVFDATSLGSSMGGDAIEIVNLFGDTPRALAVSPGGGLVYAAVFHSGNRTTTVSEGLVQDGGNGTIFDKRLPPPAVDVHGDPAPEVGLIVKQDPDTGDWLDELGRDWSAEVKFDLPDYDVFVIDALASPPEPVTVGTSEYTGVGTILFNMAVNPLTGNIYVSNTEAFNEVRFEGPGVFSPTTVRSHLHESHITVIDIDAPLIADAVIPRHLNTHIDYNTCCDALPNTTNDRSLAFPVEMAVNDAGTQLYVSAFGSSKIGTYTISELEAGTFTPDAADQIALSGGGPTGVVLDESRDRLYTLTRFDNSVSIIDTTSAPGSEVGHVALHNPEPASVVDGRPFLYDATLTSSNGDQACASCHVFGDFDSLGWDLGNPDDETANNPGPFTLRGNLFIDEDFHPMKGPMTTQSLRGMDNHGPMHWRGDRTGGNDSNSLQPDSGTFDEHAAFRAFNGAFVGLIGRSETLTSDQMDAFTEFALQIMYPPNPVRALDNSMTSGQQDAFDRYFGPISDTAHNCNGCHTLDEEGNAEHSVERPGFFGTDGRSSFENEPQMMKVAHLRNAYQKVGMFGMADVPFFNGGDNGDKGDQIRGFGFLHDGSVDSIFRFFQAGVFNLSGGNPGGFANNASGDADRRDMEDLVLAFPNNLAPIVGQQVTLAQSSPGATDTRIDLMLARADAVPSECDVVVSGLIAGEQRGALYIGGGLFITDEVADGNVPKAAILTSADTIGQEATFTAVPPGDGARIGIDRDGDGFRNGDEIDGGGDPADELSLPCATPTTVTYKAAKVLDKKGKLTLKAEIVLPGYTGDATVQVSADDLSGVFFDSGVLGSDFVPNSKASKFQYKGPKRTPGIVKIQVKEDRKVADGYKVSVKTKEAWTLGEADGSEASTFVTLNVGGACFDGNATKVK